LGVECRVYPVDQEDEAVLSGGEAVGAVVDRLDTHVVFASLSKDARFL